MTKLSRHDVVLNAVARVKSGGFKATAIKVELEAQLDRPRGNDNDQMIDCYDCGGNWEDAENCEYCDGNGYYHMVNGEVENCNEDEEGAEECSYCCGVGRLPCSTCEEGQVRDDDEGASEDWGNTAYCHEWIMSKLADLGLAEYKDERHLIGHSYQFETNWYNKGALKYAEFYVDGSVDSEFTFTLSLKRDKDIFLLPKIVEIFRDFAVQAGGGEINIARAGMHMALLNHKDCMYGRGYSTATSAHMTRYQNFRRSMTLLLPALYFLASNDSKSRQLEFRKPSVGCADTGLNGGKYSAINYTQGALEFRTFETCYDKPEAILDNFVVMRNCLKYWTKTYKPSGVDRITKLINFGNDDNDQLDRLYSTVEHLDVLNAGLLKLKPSYLTIRECKQQRKFKTNKGEIKRTLVKMTDQAKVEYQEYEERYSWWLQVKRKKYEADYLQQQMDRNEGHLLDHNLAETLVEVNNSVDKLIKTEASKKQELDQYIEEKLNRFNRNNAGSYPLTV